MGIGKAKQGLYYVSSYCWRQSFNSFKSIFVFYKRYVYMSDILMFLLFCGIKGWDIYHPVEWNCFLLCKTRLLMIMKLIVLFIFSPNRQYCNFLLKQTIVNHIRIDSYGHLGPPNSPAHGRSRCLFTIDDDYYRET